MPIRQLLPVPIPRGRSGNTGYLSVYFEPRLLTGGTLSNFSDWRVWPNVVNALTFTVRVNGSIRAATKVSPPASLAKWQAVFGSATRVDGFIPIARALTPPLKTYRQTELVALVNTLYGGTMLLSPTQPPTAAQLMGTPATAAFLDGTSGHIPEALDFVAPVVDPPDPPEEPDDDFHAAYGMLSAHPELMRLLGMVVDLEVTLPVANPLNVRVDTNYPTLAGYGTDRYEVPFRVQTTDQFWPRANTAPAFNEQTAGWMNLGSGWGLTQTNDLNASSRLANLAGNIAAGDDSGALPAQDEGGISLLRTDNAAAVRNQWVRQAAIEADIVRVNGGQATFVDLWAEDITVGIRVDVRDTANNIWRSLFQRQADEYNFPRNTAQDVVPAPDEGWTALMLSSEQRESYILFQEAARVPTATLRIRDTYFTWNGWSAAAPPPSNVVDADGNVVAIEESASAGDAKVRMNARYSVVPGTLPRLRYGRVYEERARAVFLDGSSRALSETQLAGTVSPALRYGRQSPVAAPEVVRRFAKPVPGVGESTETIVLLGDYDTANSAVAKHERVIFPARSPQARCELHDLPNGGVDPSLANYNLLASRDAKAVVSQCTTDAVSGDLLADPARGSNPAVVYLPEPPAAAAAFTGLPGSTGPVVAQFLGAWPTVRAARMIVEAGTAAPTVTTTSGGRTVRVRVPKAADVTVALSTGLNPAFLDHFALWGGLGSAQKTAWLPDAQNGRLWMMSPARNIRLIHAVRRPMLAPVVVSLAGTRPEVGSDSFVFDTTITMDRASTDQVRLRADFTDPIDDPAEPAPSTQDRSVVLAQLAIDPTGAPTTETVVDASAVIHDQKRHDVLVEAEAFSRFARYFTEQADKTFNLLTVTLNTNGVVDSSVVLSNPTTGEPYVRDVDYTVDRTAGTVRRLINGAIGAGTTVRAQFIARPVSRVSTEGGAAAFPVTIPASVAPSPVEVREVVPATAVSETSGADFVERTRTGTIVRVWSERGWYSSGTGELLGVVLDRSGAALPAHTRLGRDPITTGDGSPNPVLADFPRAAVAASNVDGAVDIAAHAIEFDPVRGLWYSDVEVAGGVGYRPFLRLTLTRYQPEAIDFTHYSSPRQTDPVRLLPNRTVRVTKNANGTFTIRVEGVEHDGIPNEAAGNALMFNSIDAEFQGVNAGISDPDLRWQKVGSTVPLVRTVLANGLTRWEATVSKPATLTGTGRIAITEYEPAMERQGETGRRATKSEVAIETLEITALL